MTALVVGTLLAIVALAYVLAPLFIEQRRPIGGHTGTASAGTPPAAASPERDLAVAALREIEFDRATGKLSESDYAELKAAYTGRAIAAMRADDAMRSPPEADTTTDAVEAKILEYRLRRPTCSICGPRPERDARWCSSCGRWLAGHCRHCSQPVPEPGARYCARCGKELAA